MNKEKIANKIKELKPWYQHINLNGIMTIKKGDKYVHAKAGEHTWKTIKTFLPSSLDNMRISDLNSTNILWTNKDEIPIIVDVGTIRALEKEGIDNVVYKTLVKRIQYKNRIDMFLEGYSKYRDISGILNIAKKNNWTYGKRKLKSYPDQFGRYK